MRRSNHQAEVEDLKAAGLNPLLAVNGGASTFLLLVLPHRTLMLAWALLSDAVNSAIAVRDMKIKMRSLKSLSTILQDTENKKLCKLLLRINNERLPKTSNKNLFKRNLKEDLDSQIKSQSRWRLC